jgi:cellulose synthase/poly-beta-1,6-N-acetylglucosamine synthase-like glycosyltransferase
MECVEVSVVVPAFNEEENLRACLEALRVQDHPSFEVIVVDDGSRLALGFWRDIKGLVGVAIGRRDRYVWTFGLARHMGEKNGYLRQLPRRRV